MTDTKLNLISGDWAAGGGERGDSSYGPRAQGKAAVEFNTTIKTAYISAGTPA